jgi:hypothetical protein
MGTLKITGPDRPASIPGGSASRTQQNTKNSENAVNRVKRKNPKGASISHSSQRVGPQAAGAGRGRSGLGAPGVACQRNKSIEFRKL